MESEKWGVGNASESKSYATVKVGNEEVELIHGEFPHSRQDNTTYARFKDKSIEGFSGHRWPFKIVIEEYNYLKESHMSGNDVRKGGNVKVFVKDVQIFDEFCRSYERGYKLATQFIDSMEMEWSWFPFNTEEKIGRTIFYREHKFVIKSFVTSQACMILEPLDGSDVPRFAYESEEYFEEGEKSLKVEINSPHIWWWTK